MDKHELMNYALFIEEYDPVQNSNNILLIRVAVQVDPKNFMLSERGKAQKSCSV